MALIKYKDIFQKHYLASFEEPCIPLGFSDAVKWLPLSENILLVGGADIGRTSYLKSGVFHLISQYRPNDICLWLYDGGLYTFNDFSRFKIPHIKFACCEGDYNQEENLVNALYEEVTTRQTLLADTCKYTSFAEHKKHTGIRLAPKGIVLLNFGENFFRRLRDLPPQHVQKFSEAVRVSKSLDICIALCIQDYASFFWGYGIDEQNFPRKVAIIRSNDSDQDGVSAPVSLLSTDYPLPWCSPIYLSQEEIQEQLNKMFLPKQV